LKSSRQSYRKKGRSASIRSVLGCRGLWGCFANLLQNQPKTYVNSDVTVTVWPAQTVGPSPSRPFPESQLRASRFSEEHCAALQVLDEGMLCAAASARAWQRYRQK